MLIVTGLACFYSAYGGIGPQSQAAVLFVVAVALVFQRLGNRLKFLWYLGGVLVGILSLLLVTLIGGALRHL